jgi:hypothetical protein
MTELQMSPQLLVVVAMDGEFAGNGGMNFSRAMGSVTDMKYVTTHFVVFFVFRIEQGFHAAVGKSVATTDRTRMN